MPRFFISISYRGSCFHGWQRQPGDRSVQQTIEDAFSTVLRIPVSIVGAGRTDTGVNARIMYAHLDLPSADLVADSKRILNGVNRLCGNDIAVHSIFPVPETAHARFDAVERTYRYFTHTEKNPFSYPLSWQSPPGLDYENMNKAAEILLETEDFTSFSKLHTDVKTNICKVTRAEWIFENGNPLFVISADRFLRNMVRAVVGTLVDVGRGKIDIDGFRRIVECKDRCAAGTSMPGYALFLWDIKYPEGIVPPEH